MRLFIVYGHHFGEKVIGNMVNLPDFCTACDFACAHCRVKYSCFAPDVCGVFRTRDDLPELLDDPEPYLPNIMPKIDLLLAIGLHPDLLVGLPSIAKKAGAKAVIVPIEETRWCPQSLRDELRHSFDEQRMEYAFPKPFCELDYSNGLIGDFVRRYKIGKPLLEISISGSRISDVRVVRSAPCGSTWYVAQQIRWLAVDDRGRLEQAISNAHHGYPCTASMEMDAELKDTILHKSGYIIREAVESALIVGSRRKSSLRMNVTAQAHY